MSQQIIQACRCASQSTDKDKTLLENAIISDNKLDGAIKVLIALGLINESEAIQVRRDLADEKEKTRKGGGRKGIDGHFEGLPVGLS